MTESKQMQSPQTHPQQLSLNPVSGVIKLALVSLFALLWAIWIQPHTIALHQALLTAGSLLGLYVMSQNLHLFKTRRAIPIYLIGILFAWITFHLFFLSHQYELQLAEYLTIWKRIAWGVPFAIGLGIVLGQPSNKKAPDQDSSSLKYEGVWWIFYAGVAAPTAIYLMRALLMLVAGKLGLQLPIFLINAPASSDWHVTKMNLEFFCLPALALACSQLICVCNSGKTMLYSSRSCLPTIINVSTIMAVFFTFYLLDAKNGIAYSLLSVLIMLTLIIFSKKVQWNARNIFAAIVVISSILFLLMHHIERNEAWKTLFADIKVAQNLEISDAWKDYGVGGYPVNELGKVVNGGNYLRAAWAKVALQFISETPLGYGLVYTSFGHMAKEKWSDSALFQAHSAWLDLTLGIGIPGTFLLVLAGVLGLKNSWNSASAPWGLAAIWIVFSVSSAMLTTEFSHKVYIDPLLFLILWAGGLGLNPYSNSLKATPKPKAP